MDTTKAKEELGWRPEYSAVEALRSTLDGSEN
jgi:nucleoside-diphosphate-sugar epimerase